MLAPELMFDADNPSQPSDSYVKMMAPANLRDTYQRLLLDDKLPVEPLPPLENALDLTQNTLED